MPRAAGGQSRPQAAAPTTAAPSATRPLRIGLVLGAGGVLGGAWLTGGLQALAAETGWDPAGAEFIVGTSAGSMIGALLAAGLPPWFMAAHSMGETFEGMTDAAGRPQGEADRAAGADYRLQRGVIPRPVLGSPGLALRAALRPNARSLQAMAAGWLPRGFISTAPLQDLVRRVVPKGWGPHPGLRIVAVDYATGERVAFGSNAAPQAELADAVAASCAIPGFYHPVKIGSHSYIDGGLWSTSNLDLLAGEGLDLVICMNPMSSVYQAKRQTLSAALGARVRQPAGRRLGRETRQVRDAGTSVLLIQPTGRDLRAMGVNLMSRKRRNHVIATSRETVADQVRAAREEGRLPDLPAGPAHKIARPPGPASNWPSIVSPAPLANSA